MCLTSPPGGSGVLQLQNQWPLLACSPAWRESLIWGQQLSSHTLTCHWLPLQTSAAGVGRLHDSFWVAAVVGDLSYLGSLIVMGHGRGIYTKGLCESRCSTQHQQVTAPSSRPFSSYY